MKTKFVVLLLAAAAVYAQTNMPPISPQVRLLRVQESNIVTQISGLQRLAAAKRMAKRSGAAEEARSRQLSLHLAQIRAQLKRAEADAATVRTGTNKATQAISKGQLWESGEWDRIK